MARRRGSGRQGGAGEGQGQRRAPGLARILGFALERLGLTPALEDVETLRAENGALRSRIRELERALYPEQLELDAGERPLMDQRSQPDRGRGADRI